MKTIKLLKYSVFLLLGTCPLLSIAQANILEAKIERVNDKTYIVDNDYKYLIEDRHVMAKLKEGGKPNLERLEYKVIKDNTLLFTVPEGMLVEHFGRYLVNLEIFDYVEYNPYYELCSITPNDTYVGSQWYLNKIQAGEAWEITTGLANVKVAVIDTGVDPSHADLHTGPNQYTNFDFANGYDYVAQTTQNAPTDRHGTMVAGIIGAKTNNGLGIAGLAGGNNSHGVTVLPYRAGASTIDGSYAVQAIYDAMSKGVKVINLSFEGIPTNTLETAINYAYNQGANIVCSSGNGSHSSVSYPAAYANTIAVGASNSAGNRASFSNYGSALDLVAPGENIYSTALNNGYGSDSGTSYSAPMVTATIALMLSINPSLTPIQVKSILTSTCYKPSSYPFTNGKSDKIGYGILQVKDAINTTLNQSLGLNGPMYVGANSTVNYAISHLPPSMTVQWSLINGFGPVAPTLQIYNNTCVINNNLSKSYAGEIRAVVKLNGNIINTFTQKIVFYSGFYGTYGTTQFTPNSPIWITPGTSITLISPNLVSKNVSHSVITPSEWFYDSYQGSLRVRYPSGNTTSPILINIAPDTNNNGYDNTYQITLMPTTVLHSLAMQVNHLTNDVIEISFMQKHTDTPEGVLEFMANTECPNMNEYSEEWQIDVVQASTGELVLHKTARSEKCEMSTHGWKKGIYVVKASRGSCVLSHKITIY